MIQEDIKQTCFSRILGLMGNICAQAIAPEISSKSYYRIYHFMSIPLLTFETILLTPGLWKEKITNASNTKL